MHSFHDKTFNSSVQTPDQREKMRSIDRFRTTTLRIMCGSARISHNRYGALRSPGVLLHFSAYDLGVIAPIAGGQYHASNAGDCSGCCKPLNRHRGLRARIEQIAVFPTANRCDRCPGYSRTFSASGTCTAECAITGSTVERTFCRFVVRDPEYWRLQDAPVHCSRRCEMLL
jgi:hypothetical protein